MPGLDFRHGAAGEQTGCPTAVTAKGGVNCDCACKTSIVTITSYLMTLHRANRAIATILAHKIASYMNREATSNFVFSNYSVCACCGGEMKREILLASYLMY